MKYAKDISKIKLHIYTTGYFECKELNLKIKWNLNEDENFDFKNNYDYEITKLNPKSKIKYNDFDFIEIKNKLYVVKSRLTVYELNNLQINGKAIILNNIDIGERNNYLNITFYKDKKQVKEIKTTDDPKMVHLKIEKNYDEMNNYVVTLENYTNNYEKIVKMLRVFFKESHKISTDSINWKIIEDIKHNNENKTYAKWIESFHKFLEII